MLYGGLIAAVGGLVFSLTSPTQNFSAVTVGFLGVIISQFGTILFNRWGRNPIMQEIIDQALKGLDSRYIAFHYYLATDHVILSPSGVFTLLPRFEDGEITTSEDQWWRTRPKGRFSRRVSTKRIKGLEKEAGADSTRLEKYLERLLPDRGEIEVRPLLLFIHKDATLKSQNDKIDASHLKKLKPTLRRMSKGRSLTPAEVDEIRAHLGIEIEPLGESAGDES